jgi:hypothetical protein
MRKYLVFLLLVVVFFPAGILARVGVGVNTGKIQVEKPLKAGVVYDLPFFTVLNTGDEPSDYEIGIEYYETQPQLKPPRAWFRFAPPTFPLDPGKGGKVAVQLVLPLKAQPGDYFAFLEARPIQKDLAGGGARIGVAAAAKLYFTVSPANIFQAIYYRISFLFGKYSPWSWVVLVIVIGAIIIALFRKFFKFQIGISKK